VRIRWVALLLTIVPFFNAAAPSKCRRNPRVPVTVAKVERRPVPLELAASGTIEPIQTADVGSQVGGVVTRIRIREGDYVRAGQVLVELDSRPFHAALAQARGVLAKDHAQAEAARLDWERAQKMLQQNLIAQADYDQKRAAAQSAAGVVAADSGAVIKARLDLEYASIRAPITGRSGKLNVHVGDLVKENTSEPLITINQISPIRVRFSVPQSDIPSIQRYRDRSPHVYVRPAAGDSAESAGTLTFVDNQVDPSSGTLLLKGELANKSAEFWPGEFVEVRLVLAMESDASSCPRSR
jgi:multidrug efflux system membrane fusion protein